MINNLTNIYKARLFQYFENLKVKLGLSDLQIVTIWGKLFNIESIRDALRESLSQNSCPLEIINKIIDMSHPSPIITNLIDNILNENDHYIEYSKIVETCDEINIEDNISIDNFQEVVLPNIICTFTLSDDCLQEELRNNLFFIDNQKLLVTNYENIYEKVISIYLFDEYSIHNALDSNVCTKLSFSKGRNSIILFSGNQQIREFSFEINSLNSVLFYALFFQFLKVFLFSFNELFPDYNFFRYQLELDTIFSACTELSLKYNLDNHSTVTRFFKQFTPTFIEENINVIFNDLDIDRQFYLKNILKRLNIHIQLTNDILLPSYSYEEPSYQDELFTNYQLSQRSYKNTSLADAI
ncbi:MAG: hypothetical protein PVH88_05150 [Ignavibacteria bacterium]|jgi:hypothetical protein